MSHEPLKARQADIVLGQVAGKGVPELVQVEVHPRGVLHPPDPVLNAVPRKPMVTVARDEQCLGPVVLPLGEVVPQVHPQGGIDGDHPGTLGLRGTATDGEDVLLQVDITDVQGKELGLPHPREEQGTDDDGIPLEQQLALGMQKDARIEPLDISLPDRRPVLVDLLWLRDICKWVPLDMPARFQPDEKRVQLAPVRCDGAALDPDLYRVLPDGPLSGLEQPEELVHPCGGKMVGHDQFWYKIGQLPIGIPVALYGGRPSPEGVLADLDVGLEQFAQFLLSHTPTAYAGYSRSSGHHIPRHGYCYLSVVVPVSPGAYPERERYYGHGFP